MNFIFNKAKAQLGGGINWNTDVIKVMLINDTITADKTMDYVSEVASAELSGTGYSRKQITNATVVEDDANGKAYFKGDSVTWNNISAGTANALIIYKEVTTDADSVLIAHIDNPGFPFTTNGANIVFSGDPVEGYFSDGDSLMPQTKAILTDDVTYPTDTDKVTALKTLYGV